MIPSPEIVKATIFLSVIVNLIMLKSFIKIISIYIFDKDIEQIDFQNTIRQRSLIEYVN